MVKRWRYVVVVVGIALAAACSGGGDGDDSSEPAPEPTSRTTEASTTTSAPATTAPAPAGTSPTTVAAPEPTTPADDAGAFTLPDVVGLDLQAAQDAMQAAGYFLLTSHDATGQGRMQVLDRNWKVCSQTPAPGTPTSPTVPIDFGAVKDTEDCP